jgi:hypothetical protein
MIEQSKIQKPVLSDAEGSKIQNWRAIPPNVLARVDRVMK